MEAMVAASVAALTVLRHDEGAGQRDTDQGGGAHEEEWWKERRVCAHSVTLSTVKTATQSLPLAAQAVPLGRTRYREPC